MRILLAAALALAVLTPAVRAEDKTKQAPKVVLKSADGTKSYDLAKLTAEGPVLVRLTCACSGCDAEVGFFQKLQDAYAAKGLKTVAVFKEKPESLEDYVGKKKINFLVVDDPKGELWKTFDAKAMPTNILIEKGGRVVKVVPGCTRDGRNAQALSGEIAKLLGTEVAQVAKAKDAGKK
jgi:peroxiredoxin